MGSGTGVGMGSGTGPGVGWGIVGPGDGSGICGGLGRGPGLGLIMVSLVKWFNFTKLDNNPRSRHPPKWLYCVLLLK